MNPSTHHFFTSDTEPINALLRSEMAAVETYTRAMATFNEEAVIAELQKIRDEHSRAVRELRDQIVRRGGKPPTTTGEWGLFAVTGPAKAIGPRSVLAALREGEEHAISTYAAALEDEDFHPDCQRCVQTELIPACYRHIEQLNRLLEEVSR